MSDEPFQRDTETVLSQKLNEMTEEVRRESHKAQSVRQDMEKMKQANGKAEQELAALRQKMQSREAARAQDMDNLTAVQNKLKVGQRPVTIHRSTGRLMLIIFQVSIGVNHPAIVREIPHFDVFPAFPHFC